MVLTLAPAAVPQENAAPQQFDVASVKPNSAGNNLVMIGPPVGGRFTARNVPVATLVSIAYDVRRFEIFGAPGWVEKEGFDIEAQSFDPRATMDGIRPMLQSLLEDRFRLRAHRETRDVPVYTLTLPKGPSKLPVAHEGGCADKPPAPGIKSAGSAAPPLPGCGGVYSTPSHLDGGNISMKELALALAGLLDRPVIDMTGFTGKLDVRLEFSPEGVAASPNSQLPTIFKALEDQFGLKLESTKGPRDMLYIDHVEKPSEN